MKWKKCTALAIVAGAALSLAAIAPVSATSLGQAATTMAEIAVPQAGGNVIEARDHGRHGGYGRRGRHGRYGYRRHRGHGGIGLALPLLAIPLIIESERQAYDHGEYGDDEGFACYRACRDYNDADYCRYNFRDFC
jgi:hypothetical protein